MKSLTKYYNEWPFQVPDSDSFLHQSYLRMAPDFLFLPSEGYY